MRIGSAFILAALCVAAACGPKSKPAAEPVVANEPVPGGFGGDSYGGAGYGGGDAYGGGMYGGGGGAYAGRGVFDCVSGIPECDSVLTKYAKCMNEVQGLDEDTRKQTMDGLQAACEQMKNMANDPQQRQTIVDACTEMESEGAKNASQMGCTW